MMIKKSVLYMLSLFSLFGTTLQASHGIYNPGYGAKALGMAGAVTANPQDALIASTNPAGMSWIPDQTNADLLFFSPIRGYSYSNYGGHHIKSKRNVFPVPGIGWKMNVNPCLAAGVSFYGNGGMNTTYGHNNPAFGRGNLNLDYSQAILAPTLSYSPFCNHSFGVSILLAAQALKFSGLQNFKPFSYRPEHVTNKGHYYTYGAGVRVGWLGQLRDDLWVGAAYATKTYFNKFRHYDGLLAGGKVDGHENFSIGIRYQFVPCFNISFDAQRILFSKVPPFGNTISPLFAGKQLGRSNGPGFGWRDLWVYKVGLVYDGFDCLTLRAGYSYSKIPYNSKQIDFNILAPSVCRHHFTAGGSWFRCDKQELSFGFLYALKGHRKGISNFGLGEVKHWMYQFGVDFGYTWYY
jgi:long-chain fatty acid transport protein